MFASTTVVSARTVAGWIVPAAIAALANNAFTRFQVEGSTASRHLSRNV